nr:hypothetical protein [Tanacetum cinerariifolium]
PKRSEDEVIDDAGKKSTKVSRKKNRVQDPTKEDPGREIAQRNEFESMFGQDKDANGNRMFTHVSAAGSTYVNLGRSIPVNAATLPNVDLPIDPLIPDLEDTRLVDLPKGKHAIGTKWVYRNKIDERGIIVRNKTRLVAQGYTQEEGIDYDEVFASVARIEAIRLFLAYASLIGFIVYQMDLKSAFLYGTIEEEVFRSGIIDKTLFIKKDKGNILLVQVFVDDIIFGSTKKSLCIEFEGLIHKKFQMSSIWELTFFLGLQVMQREDGIFISQDKYVADILKKFDLSSVKTPSTPIETNKALLKVKEAEDVDVYLYRLMIGSLMYRTASRPDIMFVVCACARFQVTPKISHLRVVKRNFRYLKGQPKLGLWYPRDSPFDLEAFSDSDYAGAILDRKSTTGDHYVADLLTKAFDIDALYGLEMALVMNLELKLKPTESKGFEQIIDFLNATAKVNNVNGVAHIQALVDKKKVIITEASIRRDIRFEDKGGVDCLSNEVIFEQLTLMGFVQVFLDNQVEGMDRHNVTFVISSHTKKVFANMKREGKDFSRKVLNLEEAKTAQVKEIASLKKRVKKLEQKRNSRTSGLKILKKIGTSSRIESSTEASLGYQEDASKQRRMIDNIDQDVEITLVDDTQGRMKEEDMFEVNDIDGDEVVVDVSASEKVDTSVKEVEKEVSTADPITTICEVVNTIAKPNAIKTAATTIIAVSTRPKEKGIVMQEPPETPLPKPINSSQKSSQAKGKGKGKMFEPENPLKRKDQIMIDEEFAKNLEAQMQAELEEEERLARLKEDETNIALIES